MAFLGWAGTMLTTRSPILAKALFAEFRADQYDIALRKAARFARYFWRRLDIANDPFFNFPMGTNEAERRALLLHLEAKKEKIPATEYLTDRLYIQAATIHRLLEQGQAAEAEIAEFYQLANEALALIEIKEQKPKPIVSKKTDNMNFDKDSARQTLEDFAALLPNKQWPWYVVSGTFLGLHREGGFLAHDYDIDLGINAEDIDWDKLVETLRASPLLIIKKIDYYIDVYTDQSSQRRIRKLPSIIKLIHENGMQVDLFIHYTENERCWHGSSIHRWDNTPFALVERDLAGVSVFSPVDADLYLTENYGDWRTPITEFDCTTGTPNLVVASNFISRALLVKRYAFFALHEPKQARKLQTAMLQVDVFALRDEKIFMSESL